MVDFNRVQHWVGSNQDTQWWWQKLKKKNRQTCDWDLNIDILNITAISTEKPYSLYFYLACNDWTVIKLDKFSFYLPKILLQYIHAKLQELPSVHELMKDHFRHVPLVLTSQSLLTLPLGFVCLTMITNNITVDSIHQFEGQTWSLENKREQQLLLHTCYFECFQSELHTSTGIQPKKKINLVAQLTETYISKKTNNFHVTLKHCSEKHWAVMVILINLYCTFSIFIYSTWALQAQAQDLWVRSDVSIYRHHWQPLSVY